MPSIILKDNQKRCKKYRRGDTEKVIQKNNTERVAIERYEAITHAPHIEFLKK